MEIAAGKRLFDWHIPDGYNAHGDCPNRIGELEGIILAGAAWAQGDADTAGQWAGVLGNRTAEKCWLVASLSKNVSAQHKEYGGEKLLAKPSV